MEIPISTNLPLVNRLDEQPFYQRITLCMASITHKAVELGTYYHTIVFRSALKTLTGDSSRIQYVSIFCSPANPYFTTDCGFKLHLNM